MVYSPQAITESLWSQSVFHNDILGLQTIDGDHTRLQPFIIAYRLQCRGKTIDYRQGPQTIDCRLYTMDQRLWATDSGLQRLSPQTSDYRLQIIDCDRSDCRLQTVDCSLQIIDYKPQTMTIDYQPSPIDYRLQALVMDYRLQALDYSLLLGQQTIDYRLQTIACRLWTIEYRLQTLETITIDYRLDYGLYMLQRLQLSLIHI